MLTAAMGRGGKRSKAGSRTGSPGGSSHEGSIARVDQSHSQVILVNSNIAIYSEVYWSTIPGTFSRPMVQISPLSDWLKLTF